VLTGLGGASATEGTSGWGGCGCGDADDTCFFSTYQYEQYQTYDMAAPLSFSVYKWGTPTSAFDVEVSVIYANGTVALSQPATASEAKFDTDAITLERTGATSELDIHIPDNPVLCHDTAGCAVATFHTGCGGLGEVVTSSGQEWTDASIGRGKDACMNFEFSGCGNLASMSFSTSAALTLYEDMLAATGDELDSGAVLLPSDSFGTYFWMQEDGMHFHPEGLLSNLYVLTLPLPGVTLTAQASELIIAPCDDPALSPSWDGDIYLFGGYSDALSFDACIRDPSGVGGDVTLVICDALPSGVGASGQDLTSDSLLECVGGEFLVSTTLARLDATPDDQLISFSFATTVEDADASGVAIAYAPTLFGSGYQYVSFPFGGAVTYRDFGTSPEVEQLFGNEELDQASSLLQEEGDSSLSLILAIVAVAVILVIAIIVLSVWCSCKTKTA
jgi:hypothetical protein